MLQVRTLVERATPDSRYARWNRQTHQIQTAPEHAEPISPTLRSAEPARSSDPRHADIPILAHVSGIITPVIDWHPAIAP
jgi:hypothetical protein